VKLLGAKLEVVPVQSLQQGLDASDRRRIPCWNPSSAEVGSVPLGKDDGRCGQAAYDWLVAATRGALAGEVDAITTAPLSKGALHLAGLKYPGHTEILAEVCGVREFGMMLYLPPTDTSAANAVQRALSVVHVTLHTSIRSVPDLLTTDRVAEKIDLIDHFVKEVGTPQPKIGVCALNPHAGEGGLFGDEEARIIQPAVERMRAAGRDVTGPWPADAAQASVRRRIRRRRRHVSRSGTYCAEAAGLSSRGERYFGSADCAHQPQPRHGV
jgi:4-hydroxythreonine-4-phosphate dehydrogenase